MINVLHKIMNSSCLDQFIDHNNPLLKNLPLHLFWKDKNGVYIGCSDGLANSLGFEGGNKLLGMTDYDLSWANSAPEFRLNDQQVISSGKPKIAFETGTLHNGAKGQALSYKLPLRSQSKSIIGVIGISIELDHHDLISVLVPDYLKVNSTINFIDSISSYKLTKRESECLFYLTKGFTIKEIAKKISLSHRTVEHYLARVKEKLCCHTRSQLIAKVNEA